MGTAVHVSSILRGALKTPVSYEMPFCLPRLKRPSWSFLNRYDRFVVVASSIFRMNRVIGLLPKLISKTPGGDYTIDHFPSCVWLMYLSFVVLYVVTTTIIALRVHHIDLPSILVTYFFGRIFTAAGIHMSFLRKYRIMHDSLRRFNRLNAKAPVYWMVLPYFFTGIAVFLAALRHILRHKSVVGFQNVNLRWMTDVFPALILANSCCQVSLKVDTLKHAIQDLNHQILALLELPGEFDLKHILSRHVELRTVCSCLNDAYGEPIFLIIFHVFLDLTFSIYITLISDPSPSYYFYVIKSMSQSIPPIILILVCQEAETAFEETKKLAVKVTKVAENWERGVYDQISEFNIQLRRLPIEFNANGCFKVNKKVLRAVVSTIITYTVILIQNVKRSW